MDLQDTEITLGTGRLLGLFFGLALVCAVFFAMGFTLGRNSGTPQATADAQPATMAVPATATSTVKPAASRGGAAAAASCPDGQTCDAKSTTDELAFIKKDHAAPPAAAATAGDVDQQPAPAPLPAATAASKPAPEMTGIAPSGGFVVQIAAVSKKDDADALAGALRKKNYPVFIAADANDRLFHIQVGPFAQRTDAQAMKDKLSSDGYNAIVK